MTQLSADNQPLEKVFSSDYQFEIPRYQRPYAWQEEQAEQLLTDLAQAQQDDGDDDYFLGTIVLVKADGKPRAEVIDGQQRLTTLTILLAVLRDLTLDHDVARGIQEYVEDKGKAWQMVAATPRLLLRPKDRDFFQTYVQSPGAVPTLLTLTDHAADSDSRRAIRDNARVLHKQLLAWSEARRLELLTFLTAGAQLVVVRTPDEASAHRIFGVMNARGLQLSPTDIFKSKVIGELGSLEDAYADKWDQAEDQVGRDAFTELFRDIRTIQVKAVAKVVLLTEFDKLVLQPYLSAHGAQAFVDDLVVPYAAAFAQVVQPAFGPGADWQKVNEWLLRLERFDNKDWRPIALWALRAYPDDPIALDALLRKLERLAASMLLRGMYTTPRVTRYLDLLNEIDRFGVDAPSFELDSREKHDTLAGLNGEIYRLQSQRRKLVLIRLDELLARATGVTYHHKTITVEHVLPQNPQAGSTWLTDFDDDARERWTHRLGNLLLLNHVTNSSARNYEFDVKKAKYFQAKGGVTNFALTSQVLDKHEWTPAVVEQRQQELVSVLAHEWDLS